jgi:hypothetical protein
MTVMDTRASPSSSSIPAPFTQLDGPEALGDAEAGHLLAYLATIRDSRAPSGRRHPLAAILAMAAAAVLTGARSFAAIAEWAADAPSRCGRRWALAARHPTTGRCRLRPPSAGACLAWTPTPWPR